MPINDQISILPYLEYLKFQKRYSPHTILSYENDLTSFFQFSLDQFECSSLQEVKPTYVRTWLASLKDKGISSKTINRKISALKSFFKFQIKQGLLQVNPLATIVSPKINKRLPQFVNEKDTELLFDKIDFPETWEGKTQALLLQLLYSTGIRLSELINLQESRIDKGNCSIKVIGKGNKERILPISTQLLDAINAYIQEKRTVYETFDMGVLLVGKTGKKLYPKYVYHTVKKYLSLVTTIDKRSPHVLRHTFATHLMNNGADLNAVKELLGHTSLAATQVYTHNTIEKLKNVYQKAHPKA